MIKNLPAMHETRVQSVGREDPLEKGMATHSSILAWKIPWTEEPGGLQPVGSQRIGHDWVINTKPSKQKLHEFRTTSVSSDQASTENTVHNQYLRYTDYFYSRTHFTLWLIMVLVGIFLVRECRHHQMYASWFCSLMYPKHFSKCQQKVGAQ